MATLLNELSVISSIVETMSGLTTAEQRRVLVWLEDYFGVFSEMAEGDVVTIVEPAYEDASDEYDAVEFEDELAGEPSVDTFEGLFAQVAPKTAIQKICCAAYWLETQENHDSWKSFEVNKLLKSIDVKLSSVSGTLAIDSKKDTPLVVTLGKSGDSIQGRKTFRLSDAGLQFVESRL